MEAKMTNPPPKWFFWFFLIVTILVYWFLFSSCNTVKKTFNKDKEITNIEASKEIKDNSDIITVDNSVIKSTIITEIDSIIPSDTLNISAPLEGLNDNPFTFNNEFVSVETSVVNGNVSTRVVSKPRHVKVRKTQIENRINSIQINEKKNIKVNEKTDTKINSLVKKIDSVSKPTLLSQYWWVILIIMFFIALMIIRKFNLL